MNFLLFILFFSSFMDTTHPVFKDKIQIVRKNHSVELFAVDDFPTRKNEQEAAVHYIHDYKILREIKLDKEQKNRLKDIVSESKNYDTTHLKSCPQVAKYALRFQRKEEYIVLIISPNPCSKVVIFSSAKDLNETNAELTDKNTLETLLEELGK